MKPFAAITILIGGAICIAAMRFRVSNVVSGTSATLLSHPTSASTPALTEPARSPAGDTVFSSTREVTSLAVETDGTLWAGTTGGVLRRGRAGDAWFWRKFTRRDGLPSHETRRIFVKNGAVTAEFPRASAVWRANRWHTETSEAREMPVSDGREEVICTAAWRGARFEATPTGLCRRLGKTVTAISVPGSCGTHISALLPRGSALWAALFGDGLWAFDGTGWKPVNLNLPPDAREITAMASSGETLWLGTRRAGVWAYDGRTWHQHLQPDEPYSHNAQAIAVYRNQVLVSTLEDGLLVRSRSGWHLDSVPTLSSIAPRQMAEFQGALYLRHGSGRVDRFDGRVWTRDVCSRLPRKQATMIASDRSRLYVAQWGGWSEFDGRAWTHYLKLPDLEGRTLTALYPDGDTLWIGTQNRGVAEFDHRTGRLRWHDERQGLADDWITAILRSGKTVYVGTYVGGLMRWDGKNWLGPELNGMNVTDLSPDGAGGIWVATRTGLWRRDPSGRFTRPDAQIRFLDTEIQTLCSVPDGLWVGARTGLYFLATNQWRRSALGERQTAGGQERTFARHAISRSDRR